MLKDRFPSGSLDATRVAVGAMFLERAPLIMVGPPATGKTETTRSAADVLSPGLYVEIKGAWLSRPEVLLGLPTVVSTEHGTMTVLAPNRMFAPFVSTPGFVFLDETNQCPADGMGALMSLFLERRAGFLNLHPDCWVVGAMNPGKTGTATRRMGWALVSRLAQVWVEPGVSEVAAMHAAGYPVVPLDSDQSMRDRAFAWLDRAMVAYWQQVGGIVSQEPEGWEGEPIPTVRGWRLGVACLARVRSMCAQDTIMGRPWMDAVRDAEHMVLAASVGNDQASAFLGFEQTLGRVTPRQVLDGQAAVPTGMSGACAAAWVGGWADDIMTEPSRYWYCGGSSRAADTMGDLTRAFGPDICLPHISRLQRELTKKVNAGTLLGPFVKQGLTLYADAFKRAGYGDLINGLGK